MEGRGPLGELPIHLCYLLGNPNTIQIAEYMVSKYPSLIRALYQKGPYEGENIMHIAIVKNNKELVKYLAENHPDMMKDRAIGGFFKKVIN